MYHTVTKSCCTVFKSVGCTEFLISYLLSSNKYSKTPGWGSAPTWPSATNSAHLNCSYPATPGWSDSANVQSPKSDSPTWGYVSVAFDRGYRHMCWGIYSCWKPKEVGQLSGTWDILEAMLNLWKGHYKEIYEAFISAIEIGMYARKHLS